MRLSAPPLMLLGAVGLTSCDQPESQSELQLLIDTAVLECAYLDGPEQPSLSAASERRVYMSIPSHFYGLDQSAGSSLACVFDRLSNVRGLEIESEGRVYSPEIFDYLPRNS